MTSTSLRVVALIGWMALGACSRNASTSAPATSNPPPSSPPAASATNTPPTTPAPTTTANADSNVAPEPGEEFRRMTIEQLTAILERHDAIAIIDNNGRDRYERGHIPGARWVGHDAVTADVLPQDRNAKLLFYCANEH